MFNLRKEYKDLQLEDENNLFKISFDEYVYSLELYSRSNGYFVKGEKQVQEVFDRREILWNLKRNNEMSFTPNMVKLKVDIDKKNLELEEKIKTFKARKIFNPKKYTKGSCSKVRASINTLINNCNSICVKEKYEYLMFNIKTINENKFQVLLFNNNDKEKQTYDDIIDTDYEGIELVSRYACESIMEGLNGDKTPQSYMEAVLLYDYLLDTKVNKREIIKKKTTLNSNQYLDGVKYYEDENNCPVIEYFTKERADKGIGMGTCYFRVVNKFEKDSYKFKRLNQIIINMLD